MSTVAIEFVPPEQDGGEEKAREEAQKIRELMEKYEIQDKVNSLLIPGIIEEDPDRPVDLDKKMDTVDTWKVVREELELDPIVTQVTAFHTEEQLKDRFNMLRGEGINRAILVGVPRTMADGEGNGVPPTEALEHFKNEMPSRGVILIPTREDEYGRFNFKLNKGADFALTQLLYSDYIVEFLKNMAEKTDKRPEILLSFGFVPKAERNKELIRWLIKDEQNPLVDKETQFVLDLANMSPKDKRNELVKLYKKIINGVKDLGFPIGLHLECPYGFTDPAFKTFAALLNEWEPAKKS